MASAAENLFCYVIAGFWVEIPEDSSQADVYLLADHDQEKGLEGKASEFPVKRIAGRVDDSGQLSHTPTLLAARVWCLHAREQIRNDVAPGFDGDGTAALPPVALPVVAAETNSAQEQSIAAAAASVAQKRPAAKRQSKKG